MESQWGVKGLWGSEPAGRPSPSAGRIQGGWPQGPRPQAAGSESAGPQGGLCSWARGCLSLTQCGFYTLRVGEGPGITESACSPPPPPPPPAWPVGGICFRNTHITIVPSTGNTRGPFLNRREAAEERGPRRDNTRREAGFMSLLPTLQPSPYPAAGQAHLPSLSLSKLENF